MGPGFGFGMIGGVGIRNLKRISLCSIAREKDALVAANVEFLGGASQWNVIFSREVHDWEVDVVTAFYQKL
jgi:hypothetical protein